MNRPFWFGLKLWQESAQGSNREEWRVDPYIAPCWLSKPVGVRASPQPTKLRLVTLGGGDTCHMKDQKPAVFRVCEGDAYCWVEQDSSVMLKAVTKHGDPVEMTKKEAVDLAQALLRAAAQIE